MSANAAPEVVPSPTPPTEDSHGAALSSEAQPPSAPAQPPSAPAQPPSAPPKPTALFDRKFVGGAVAIGAAYCLIVVAVAKLAGKEAAGVAGVALSAVAVAIFKQFETLRFEASQQNSAIVVLPRLSLSYLAVVWCAFVGLQFLAGIFSETLARLFGSNLQDLMGQVRYDRFNWSLAASVGAMMVVHFFGGVLSGRTSVHIPGLTYTYAVMGSFLSLCISLISWVWEAIDQRSLLPLTKMNNPLITVWILYILAALFGAAAGLSRRRPKTVSSGGA